MIDLKKLKRKLYKLYPLAIAKKNHDFVGVMVSQNHLDIKKILICLDLDESILDKIDEFNPDLIVTHHPFLYGPSKVNILRNDEHKMNIYNYLKSKDIGVISLHTNYDEASNGMNDVLASKLNLNNVEIPLFNPMMRIGMLSKPMEINEFAQYAKEKLNVKYALLIKGNDNMISRVGIIGGGGSRSYKVAMLNDCDIYISGDAPHYLRRDVINDKFNYLDVPHEVERVFIYHMESILKSIDNDLEILCIDHEIEPDVI